MAKAINPGQSSACAEHYSPHGRLATSTSSGMNQSRSSAGHYGKSMARGGTSEHGSRLVDKHSPRAAKGGVPALHDSHGADYISQPYDSDGDDWL